MSVTFNRSKIARYGLNISDINQLISTGFAGGTVGNVFEGEKRFDLVVRLDERNRKNLASLQYLYVDAPNGNKIPLSELAEIKYTTGPAKISRDDTKRRIVVGINVRNRDLQSVVNDVRKIINKKLKIPAGYSITYGGQFENLQSAKARLMIAVPIALVLIFILLHFAFGSVKDTDGTDLDPTGKNERAEYFINNYLQYIMDRATFAIRLEVHKKNASFHHELASLVREFKKLLEYTDSLYNVVYGEAAELGIFKTVIRYFMEQNNFCV